MAQAQPYSRQKDGLRTDFRGMNTVLPADQLPDGKYPYAQNIRRYLQKAIVGRSLQTTPLFTLPDPVHSVRRMNDTTPAGPPSGFVIVSGAGTKLYADGVEAETGLSGERISLVPFRPNQSVQPWMYIADDDLMLKMRSDGLTYAMGIEEPQDAPVVTFNGQQIPSSEPGVLILNGWGPSAHVGAFEFGIAQNYGWGFAATPVIPYNNPLNVFDADDNSFADSTLQHTHQYAGVVWGFTNPTAPIIPDNLALNILSEIPLNGSGGLVITNRSAGIWYSLDNGATWTQVYNTQSRVKQWDTIILPTGADPAQVQVMAFNDSHDDMVHRVYSVSLGVQSVNTLYRYIYRSSKTGALSNPSPPSNAGFNLAVQSADIVAVASTDPQVDKIDFYRFGGGLENYTYVGTAPNSAPTFTDLQPDIIVQANPELQFDNFQPFPSIDLPRSGVVNVAAGVISWVSGDQFNIRWLPGNVIVINGVAYTTDKRPTDAVTMTATDIVDGNALTYEIAQPALAAQPMRSMWGPTDNVAFMFAVGDSLRPGTLYFTKGNNPDSAPDTNQIEVTSPSEPLMGGCIVNGLSFVGSTDRFWLAYPNFFNALATVTGVAGSQFTMVLSIANRGLFAKMGICSDGGATAFFIGKDGIYFSPGGNGSQSITDDDLYNLFPHEGQVQQDIVIAGKTIYAPDFTNPDAMALSFANGYLNFDYEDTGGNKRTLVYDVAAQGWVIDVYEFPCLVHALEEGPAEGVLVGCEDGSVRELSNTGVEVATAQILMPAFNAGDTRSKKRFGDIYVEADIPALKTITVAPYTNLYNAAVAGATPAALASSGAIRAPYIINFANGDGVDARDLEASFSWTISGFTALYVWQPSIVELPEDIQDRPTDWDDAGTREPKFVQGLRIEADSLGIAKAFQVESGDDLSRFTPNEVPVIFNGQSIKPFSFTPPFVAHSMRVVATDGVPWRVWGVEWVFELYPDLVEQWQTEGSSLGFTGWGHVREANIAHISTADLTLLVTQDYQPQFQVTVPNSGGTFTKTKVTLPANKSKIYSFRLFQADKVPFRPFEREMELKVKTWGVGEPYRIIKPFGGNSNLGAKV